MAVYVNQSNFENEVLKCEGGVLVDFFANWCGPCKMLSPELEALERELGDKIKVCKVDVDESEVLAYAFNISSIPCMIYFKDGKAQGQIVGYRKKDEIIKSLNL